MELDHPKRQELMVIERTQVMDTIFLKYGLKQFDLARAVEHHKLETDTEVVALRTFLRKSRQERAMRDQGMPKLPKRLEKLVKEAIKRVQPLEPVSAEGIVPFDTFQKVRFVL